MKFLHYAFVMMLACALLMPQTSHAQLRGLKDRLKKRAERKIEREIEDRTTRRLENELNKAIDNSVENIADDIESSIEGMVMSDEPPPPIELGDNASGAADAPYVSYTIATRVKIGGDDMASRLLQRFGTNEEVIYTHGNKQRVDEGTESSQILDAEGKQNIHLNHKRKEWWSMSFDEMFQSLDQMRADVEQSRRDAEVNTDINDVNISFDPTGKTEMINGVSATQVIMTIEGTYETTVVDDSGEEVTMQGTSYVVVDTWQSKEVAGYKTIANYQRAMADVMGNAISGTGFESMFTALQSSPEMKKATEDASRQLNPEEGLPVRTRTYYVQVPEGSSFDREAVLSGSANTAGEQSQQILMTLVTEIGNLSTEPFDATMMAPTPGYSEVDSPLKYNTGG